MQKIKRYMSVILIALSVLIDTSIVPMTGASWIIDNVPMLTLMSVIALALMHGKTRGTLNGLIGGLLMDILIGYWFGLYSLVFVTVGYFAGFAGRSEALSNHIMTTVVVAALGLALYELVRPIIYYLSSGRMPVEMIQGSLIRIAIGTVLTQLLYLLYAKWTQPNWSRYAGR